MQRQSSSHCCSVSFVVQLSWTRLKKGQVQESTHTTSHLTHSLSLSLHWMPSHFSSKLQSSLFSFLLHLSVWPVMSASPRASPLSHSLPPLLSFSIAADDEAFHHPTPTQSALLFIRSFIPFPPSLLISFIFIIHICLYDYDGKGWAWRNTVHAKQHRCSNINRCTQVSPENLKRHAHPQTRPICLLLQPNKTNCRGSRPSSPLACWWDKQVFYLPLSPQVTSHACIKRDTLVNPHSISHCICWMHPVQRSRYTNLGHESSWIANRKDTTTLWFTENGLHTISFTIGCRSRETAGRLIEHKGWESKAICVWERE